MCEVYLSNVGGSRFQVQLWLFTTLGSSTSYYWLSLDGSCVCSSISKIYLQFTSLLVYCTVYVGESSVQHLSWLHCTVQGLKYWTLPESMIGYCWWLWPVATHFGWIRGAPNQWVCSWQWHGTFLGPCTSSSWKRKIFSKTSRPMRQIKDLWNINLRKDRERQQPIIWPIFITKHKEMSESKANDASFCS